MPNVRRTWAPSGETPIVRHSYQRDRISAISSITISPRLHRLGLYVHLYPDNITDQEVVFFLRDLLQHIRGDLVLLWDGGPIHRAALVKTFLDQHRRLHLYRFPSYAPELNPDESVWTKAKCDLSNSAPKDIRSLDMLLCASLRRIRRSQSLLRSCIDSSELPWR